MAIDYKPDQNDYKNLTPFKAWLMNQINTWGVNNFPFLEEDFDKLTNYGMMMKLMKALNDVISNENLVEDDMSKLYQAFTELQKYVNDYLNDLNLQDEVNNKLDEMVENGTLALLVNKAISQKIQVSTLGINPGLLTEEQVDTINNYIENNPYCSLEFGSGTYILPKSIILLQGSSISGIGNDTVLKTNSNIWAIICKGLTTINSTTCIYNLTIDGNFVGNGIYIDGTRYSRCEIHDLFIVSCLYGIRNAKPNVDNVYDNNFGVGNGGNNLHDIYIYGETPNDDTSRCIDGLVLFASDNFITNIRVSGYGNYGVIINGSGNQFTMLKSAVNHIGIRLTGGQNFGSICAEESFQNNYELVYVRNSKLNLKTASAGCIVADSLPTNLAYYDVFMEHCSQNNIKINGFVAQSFAYRKSGELAMLNLIDSILNKIEVYYGNSQVPNEYSLPIISNCAFANNIIINNQSYNNFINYNILENVTTIQASNTVLSGTYPNLTVQNNGSNVQQNFMAFDLINYIDNNLIIFDKCFKTYPPQNIQISYKFNEESSNHNYTSSSQFISSYGQNGAFLSNIKIKDILETQSDYINGINLGYTLQYVRVYLRCTHAEQGISNHELIIAAIE